jgi:hypothetical protein
MKVVEAEPLPLVSTLLGLLFAVLAIVIKVRIVAEIYHQTPIGQVKGSESGLRLAGTYSARGHGTAAQRDAEVNADPPV